MPHTLAIILTDEGNMQIQGIPDSPITCFGILRMAEMVLSEHYKQKANNLVQPVSPGSLPPGFLGAK